MAGKIAGSDFEHQRFLLMARRATNFAWSKIECPKDSPKGELQEVIRNGRTPGHKIQTDAHVRHAEVRITVRSKTTF